MASTRKVVLVTGAGTGIGAGTARHFAELGYAVVLAGLGAARLQGVRDEISAAGGEAFAYELDVVDAAARDALFEAIRQRYGRLDVLVNNAGVTGVPAGALSLDETPEHFMWVINVNLTAVFFLSQRAAMMMKDQGGGAIVSVSSVGGSAAQENGAAYCASKAGVDSLTRSLALEWARHGIRVNAVAPGDIQTEQSDNTKASEPNRPRPYQRTTPLGRPGTAREMAEVIAFLASPAASFVTGEVLRADGGFLIY